MKYYNERRFHESLDNLTPKDVYLGQGEKIKKIRDIIKQNSINKRIFGNKTRKYTEQITTFAVVHFCLTTYRNHGRAIVTVPRKIANEKRKIYGVGATNPFRIRSHIRKIIKRWTNVILINFKCVRFQVHQVE